MSASPETPSSPPPARGGDLAPADLARYREIFDATSDAIFIHDAETGDVLDVNQAMLRMYGFSSKEEYIANGTATLSNEPGYGMAEAQQRMRLAIEEGPQVFEWPAVRKNGESFWVEVSLRYSTLGGRPRVLAVSRDITERRLTQDAFLQFYDQPMGLHLIAGGDGVIRRTSRGWTAALGYTPEAIEGRNFLDLVHPDDIQKTLAEMGKLALGKPTLLFENRYRHLNGGYRDIQWSANYGTTGGLIYALGFDVTEAKAAAAAVRASLREKEALLKEVHHRVKNNLQVISSLLRLETSRAGDPGTAAVLLDMQGRIRSMALLHEALYRSGTFSRVDLASYLRELAEHLFRGQARGAATVSLQFALDPAEVGIDQAIPCGLIVNELVSNSLKHGFEAGSSGTVRLELRQIGAGRVRLTVSDTGRGLPLDFEARCAHSLGMQIVSDLVRQLSGVMSSGASPGTSFVVEFTPLPPGDDLPASSPRKAGDS